MVSGAMAGVAMLLVLAGRGTWYLSVSSMSVDGRERKETNKVASGRMKLEVSNAVFECPPCELP